MKFCASVLELHLLRNFCHRHKDRRRHRQTDIQTDRLFPEIVELCSGHPKTNKSIKNRKMKFFPKPAYFSIYVEESRKEKKERKKTRWGRDF